MRLSAALAALLVACAPLPDLPPVPAGARPGDLLRVEPIGSRPLWLGRIVLWKAGLADALPIEHGVTLRRVTYWTTAPTGEMQLASGLVALPRARSLRGVVSWQHGTTVTRSRVPSAPSEEGWLVALAFAGHGYLLAAPDYLGLGRSPGRHPYYHAASTAAAVVDLLRAARSVAAAEGFAWPEPLFLAGFSQGGHATIAALRALETIAEPGLRPTAAASIAGPFDLAGLSFPRALEGEAENASLYLGYLVGSLARVYGDPLDAVLRPEWAARVDALFDGEHEGPEIRAALPRDPRVMFRPDFLADFAAGRPTWLGARLRENSLVGFTPRAPVRLYYGSRDVDVSPEEARTRARRWAERGADVRAIDVGPLDHDASVLAAAPRVRGWFDELAARAADRGSGVAQ